MRPDLVDPTVEGIKPIDVRRHTEGIGVDDTVVTSL